MRARTKMAHDEKTAIAVVEYGLEQETGKIETIYVRAYRNGIWAIWVRPDVTRALRLVHVPSGRVVARPIIPKEDPLDHGLGAIFVDMLEALLPELGKDLPFGAKEYAGPAAKGWVCQFPVITDVWDWLRENRTLSRDPMELVKGYLSKREREASMERRLQVQAPEKDPLFDEEPTGYLTKKEVTVPESPGLLQEAPPAKRSIADQKPTGWAPWPITMPADSMVVRMPASYWKDGVAVPAKALIVTYSLLEWLHCLLAARRNAEHDHLMGCFENRESRLVLETATRVWVIDTQVLRQTLNKVSSVYHWMFLTPQGHERLLTTSLGTLRLLIEQLQAP